MTKRILVVADSEDVHADAVVARLRTPHRAPFRVDLDRFPRDYQTTQWTRSDGAGGEIMHLPTGDTVRLGEVGAVWTRKTADYAFRSDDLTAQQLAFARLETEHALFSLLHAIDCFWMNHPLAVRSAMWKGEQLQRALRMGFRIPHSIITNSPAGARAFKASLAEAMIFKTMSTPDLAADRVASSQASAGPLATTIVDDESAASLDSVAELACHFQEYVPKAYELRVTVVGERAHAARLFSQEDPRTMIDSRDMSAEIRYEAANLPAPVAQRCVAFVQSYGLNFGALDLIVTPGGDHVFLENNPGGQFLYVEQLVPELRLVDAVASRLLAAVA